MKNIIYRKKKGLKKAAIWKKKKVGLSGAYFFLSLSEPIPPLNRRNRISIQNNSVPNNPQPVTLTAARVVED